MTIFIINFIGLLFIAFIMWWFWIAKKRSFEGTEQSLIEIIVNNGTYNPAYITTKACKTVTLRFIRRDKSPCANAVVFDDFNISAELDLDNPTDIVLTPQVPGEYSFTCEMGMYQGKLLVLPGCH